MQKSVSKKGYAQRYDFSSLEKYEGQKIYRIQRIRRHLVLIKTNQ